MRAITIGQLTPKTRPLSTWSSIQPACYCNHPKPLGISKALNLVSRAVSSYKYRAVTIRRPSVRTIQNMAPPRLETLSANVGDGIALIKYNRPANANAVSTQTMTELVKVYEWVLSEPDVNVVVHSGEGRFFTAGMDLGSVPTDGPVLPDENIEMLR